MKFYPLIHGLLAVLIGAVPLISRADDLPNAQAAQGLLGGTTALTVGAGATWAPRYAGADAGHLTPVPVLSVQRGILFADTARGAGLQFQSSSGFYVSQSLFYDLGRLDQDSNWRPGSRSLAGMGDVPGSVTTRTLVAQQLTPWILASAEAEFAVRDNSRRNRYRTGVEFTAIKTATDNVTVDVDAWWGDGRYNGSYFGVTPAQASRTRFAAFSPGGGLYARSVAIGWERHFDANWSSTVLLSGTRYGGQVGDSPVVARRVSASATAFINYSY